MILAVLQLRDAQRDRLGLFGARASSRSAIPSATPACPSPRGMFWKTAFNSRNSCNRAPTMFDLKPVRASHSVS